MNRPLTNDVSNAAILPLRWVDPLQIHFWDDLLETHPEATVFHSQPWARVLSKTYGYKPQYLVAADTHRLWAMLPVFEVSSWLTGKRGISLPFTDESKPLASTAAPAELLFETALERGRERGWKYFECRNASLSFPGAEPSLAYYEHTLDLDEDPESARSRFDPSVRRAIRKAESAELKIVVSNEESSIREYYRLHCLKRREHGLPPQPYEFFRNILVELIGPGHGAVLLAYHGATAIAGIVLLFFCKKAVYKFGASDPAYEALRPNNLVMWHAIGHLHTHCFESLSFGRTSLHQQGLRRYKLQWGASEKMISYYKYDLRHDRFVTEKDKTGGVHTAIFRHCPLPLTRVAGRLLYRHIA